MYNQIHKWLKIIACVVTYMYILSLSNSFAQTAGRDGNAVDGLSVGDDLPLIITLDINGDMFDSARILSQHRFLIISFFTTYCKPCIDEFPGFLKIKRQAGDEVCILLICAGEESKDTLRIFAEEHDLKDIRIIRDRFQKFLNLMGLDANVPKTFLISNTGKVIHAQYGAFPRKDSYSVLWPLIKDNL